MDTAPMANGANLCTDRKTLFTAKCKTANHLESTLMIIPSQIP